MTTPPGPNLPTPPNIPPSAAQELSATPGQAGASMSNSPFAKMFPGGATPQQLTLFINNYLKSMISQFQQQNQSWQQSQQQLQQIEEGNDPD